MGNKLWAMSKLEIVKVAGTGFRGCFVVKAIEREDVVL